MSTRKQQAEQRAFERGQQAWRDRVDTNFYPPESEYAPFWEQGYQAEQDVHWK